MTCGSYQTKLKVSISHKNIPKIKKVFRLKNREYHKIPPKDFKGLMDRYSNMKLEYVK